MNGNDLIDLGYEPGPHFAKMLAVANNLEEHERPHAQILETLDEIYEEANIVKETIPLQNSVKFDSFIDGNTEFELDNIAAVKETMAEVVKTPTVVKAHVMPDACPAGPIGTIPVGGVVTTDNAIHPGMHSSDICCSMFLTSFDQEIDVADVLDAVQSKSHFGYGGRTDMSMGRNHILRAAEENGFLASTKMFKAMSAHLGTQGDGNHFFFVGRRENGQLTFITHHGSRNPGAQLYKEGMRVAEQFRKELSPDTLKQNAWIPYDTEEGQLYWDALQIIRDWTKYNHETIHREVMHALGMSYKNITEQFWNEHNFVFKEEKDDKVLFHHAKGATPVFGDHAHDADIHGRTIVPLNMGQPILIVENHPENKTGFAPHGAGRNMSRTKYLKSLGNKKPEDVMKDEVSHIDARFYSGKPDLSELPGAYKNADNMIRDIKKFKLAKIIEKVEPLGSMMAGELEKPWLKKKK